MNILSLIIFYCSASTSSKHRRKRQRSKPEIAPINMEHAGYVKPYPDTYLLGMASPAGDELVARAGMMTPLL